MKEEQQPLLEVKGLKKYFPVKAGILKREVATIKALDGIDFSIYPGEVLGMVGESGSGKSTAGRAAIRLIEPTSGEITFSGQNLLSLKKRELKRLRKQIQMVFQDPYASLNPRKTILENVGEGLFYHGLVQKEEEMIERVEEVLKKIGISSDAIYRYPHQFSGGQQQRICIGRAIALNPQLLVCDEAVSALDVSVQSQILNLLADLQKEMRMSYLFISHDLGVIRHLADRVVVLYLGHLMESASAEELFSNPKHPYTQALLSATPKSHPREKSKFTGLRGEVPSSLHPPSGCPFRTRCPFAQPECALPPPRKVLQDPKSREEHSYFCILD